MMKKIMILKTLFKNRWRRPRVYRFWGALYYSRWYNENETWAPRVKSLIPPSSPLLKELLILPPLLKELNPPSPVWKNLILPPPPPVM